MLQELKSSIRAPAVCISREWEGGGRREEKRGERKKVEYMHVERGERMMHIQKRV